MLSRLMGSLQNGLANTSIVVPAGSQKRVSVSQRRVIWLEEQTALPSSGSNMRLIAGCCRCGRSRQNCTSSDLYVRQWRIPCSRNKGRSEGRRRRSEGAVGSGGKGNKGRRDGALGLKRNERRCEGAMRIGGKGNEGKRGIVRKKIKILMESWER